MNAPEPKPAASLNSTLIRRGEGRAAPAAATPPDTASRSAPALRSGSDLAIPPAPSPKAAGAAPPAGRRRRLVSWHNAGMFGVLYLAALVLFATAFDMWPR